MTSCCEKTLIASAQGDSSTFGTQEQQLYVYCTAPVNCLLDLFKMESGAGVVWVETGT